MARVMNVVFGIGIAILFFMVVMLGTQVFYKEPMYEDYCNSSAYSKPIPAYGGDICTDNMTVKECNLLMIKQQDKMSIEQQAYYDRCSKEYGDASKIYGKNLFIINNIVGIIAVVASMFLLVMVNIAAGVSFAGLALIVYGFMRGWQGTGDVTKFLVGLVVAAIFVVFAVLINKRYSGKKDSKRK